MGRILITGASGKLGREIARLLPEALAPSHAELDITDFGAVSDYLWKNRIETIIHCAALTSVRFCEENKDYAYRVNVEGTFHLCHPDIYLIYISTACVFPGNQLEKYYTEGDFPDPCNYYGFTKMEAEAFVRAQGNSLIVRTNFAPRGKWPYPQAFTDRYGTYLYADQVAQKLVSSLEYKPRGVIHICGDRRFSMYEFARLGDPDVQPITLKDYRGPHLTQNMCLASEREGTVHFGY